MDINQLQKAFVSFMREKHATESGRKDTLEILMKEISFGISKEAQENGATEVPKDLNELTKEKFRQELEQVLANLSKN